MSMYWQAGQFREIEDATVAAWVAAGNPKATGLVVVPEAPSYDPETQSLAFDGTDWVITARSAEEIAQALAARRANMSCSRAQGKLALLQAELLDTVEAWVATQPRATQIEYAERGEWLRTWPLVVSAGVEFGLTDTDLDDIFTLAATL